LKKVLPQNGNYRYMLDSEYVKLGRLQEFNSYDVLPMEQIADPDVEDPYKLLLDDTKIYVVSPASDKIVKIGVFGGTFSRSTKAEDSANLLETDTLAKGWEVATITNSVAGEVANLEANH
jgi:hypothetical protein